MEESLTILKIVAAQGDLLQTASAAAIHLANFQNKYLTLALLRIFRVPGHIMATVNDIDDSGTLNNVLWALNRMHDQHYFVNSGDQRMRQSEIHDD